MIGGRVQQVIRRDEHDLVEVLDPSYFDRQWRMVPHGTVAEGDHLWWQSFVGYINDEAIGFCRPAAFEAMQKEGSTDASD